MKRNIFFLLKEKQRNFLSGNVQKIYIKRITKNYFSRKSQI